MADVIRVNALDLKQLENVLRNRMGLILGPSATHGPRFYGQVSQRVGEVFSVEPQHSFLETGDLVLDKGNDETALRSCIREFVSSYVPLPEIKGLAQIRWSAVASLTLDSEFDNAFQQATAQHATRNPVTVLTDSFIPLPPRNTPVLKLLGSIQREDFCCSTASYKGRVSTWHSRIRTFADLVQGSSIVCLGVSDTMWLLEDLIAAMGAQPMTLPSSLIFLSGDLSGDERLVRRYLTPKTTVHLVNAGMKDLIAHAIAVSVAAVQVHLPYGERVTKLVESTRQFEDLVTVVNEQLESPISRQERNRLTDLLFSPSVPRWDPFVHGLDLKRTVTRDLITDARTLAHSSTRGSGAIVLKGSAASGKTTVLKRAALDLAVSGLDVLWLKPAFYQDGQRTIATVLKRVIEHLAKSKLVIVMDDPGAFGALSPKDVTTAADAASVDISLLLGVRSSDWGVRDTNELIGGLPLLGEHDVPDDLDEQELASLPAYLVSLGVYPDLEPAIRAVNSRVSNTARDTLSMLYWLLPGTKTEIQRSVRDEYFRLGDSAAFTRLIVGEQEHSSELLKHAYEMVAIASHYGAPLPVEVLVTALRVPYGEWLESSGTESGWRLFYPTGGPQEDGVSYRTRNAVVTDVIVELVNGGRMGHGGEFRILQTLVSACTGSQPPYRDFCLKILVPNTKLEHFQYLEGLDLYDRAIAALPYKDKSILHHRGIWIRNHGNDPDAARTALTEALTAQQYPYTSRGEADDHIYTSLAANELDALERRLISIDEARSRVLTYLHKARATTFFDPHGVHVEAGLMRQLIAKMGTNSSVDRTQLLNEAIANVDRTLMLLEHRQSTKGVAQDIEFLEHARDRLFELVPDEAVTQTDAEVMWKESRNQAGFVLAARFLYRKATRTDKGTDYFAAHKYALDSMERVANDEGVPSAELYDVWIHIHYHWRVVRSALAGVGGKTDWQRLYEFASILASMRDGLSKHFHLYIKGIALAHLDKWAESLATFAELRQIGLPRYVLFAGRDFLLTGDGRKATVQGEITKGGGKNFLHVPDWHVDYELARGHNWPRPGEVAHAMIRFSFMGPMAYPI